METLVKGFVCERCGKCYKHKGDLTRHLRYECGLEPQFSCPHCPHRTKRKQDLRTHIGLKHSTFANKSLLQHHAWGKEMKQIKASWYMCEWFILQIWSQYHYANLIHLYYLTDLKQVFSGFNLCNQFFIDIN